MEKVLIHIMTKERLNIEQFEVEIDCMQELREKYNIKNIVFYKGGELEQSNLINYIFAKSSISFLCFSKEEDLLEKIQKISEKNEILFVYTAMEFLIDTANFIRKNLSIPLSDNPNIFRDKSLQREFIQENNPNIGIKFIKTSFSLLDIKKIEDFISYPFILKPISGQQSSGVWKIKSRNDFEEYKINFKKFQEKLKNRGVENEEIVVEEYIDGDMYSIDYFVDKNQNIVFTKPVKVELGADFGIDDFCNISRFCSEKVEKELDFDKLKKFLKENVFASKIRNTFVHHEFKFTSKKEFKTIEINGRIGGGRVGLIGEAYGVNLFEMFINSKFDIGDLKFNNCIFYIYPTKKGILKGFNEKLFEKIKKLDSFEKLDLGLSFLNKEVGLTKDGFTKVGRIKIKNKDYNFFEKDYNFIKENYKDLLIVE